MAKKNMQNLNVDDNATCDCNIVHNDVVEKIKQGISKDEDLDRAAELFKVLGDPARLKIINSLMLAEICVCDLANLLGMSQPAISHHLKVLRQTRLVKYRRDGKTVYYKLDDEHVANVFYQGLLHVSHS